MESSFWFETINMEVPLYISVSPGPVAQLVANPIDDLGNHELNPGPAHEIFLTVILLLTPIQEVLSSVTS